MKSPLNKVIWMDGHFVPFEEATIHVLTHALHYGSSVFEGERAYKGRVFKMQEHHERLFESARILDLCIPFSIEELNLATMELLTRNNLSNAYIRPLVWSGCETLGVASYKNKTHVMIAAWSWDHYFLSDGIKLMWSDWTRPAPNMAPVHAKAAGLYMIATLSKNKAERFGFHDSLMCDHQGFVAECTGANIFMVKEGRIKTPIADSFLNGITRRTMIDLAKREGFHIEETRITKEELLKADELFVTGSAAEVTAVSSLGETSFAIGPITKQLRHAYLTLVGAN